MAESSRSQGSQVFRDGLLEGRVVVVSGAGTGLGRETALELARLGATVVGCGRREEPLAETAALAAELPGAFEHEVLDIREEERVDAFFDTLIECHGRLDVLVNNAGGQFLSPAEAISPKGFRTVVELNVTGTWLMSHAAATKAFIPGDGGKILSVTLSPHNGMPGMVHSGAARAAVENMMRTLSIEWARFGPAGADRAAGGDRLAARLPRLAGGRLLLGDDDHDRRRPRQLGRPLAARGGPDRVRQPTRRAAPLSVEPSSRIAGASLHGAAQAGSGSSTTSGISRSVRAR
jgi:NAD(P)-dependent dehydrogenase (short-subunit alcohol dehydrogenase family)